MSSARKSKHSLMSPGLQATLQQLHECLQSCSSPTSSALWQQLLGQREPLGACLHQIDTYCSPNQLPNTSLACLSAASTVPGALVDLLGMLLLPLPALAQTDASSSRSSNLDSHGVSNTTRSGGSSSSSSSSKPTHLSCSSSHFGSGAGQQGVLAPGPSPGTSSVTSLAADSGSRSAPLNQQHFEALVPLLGCLQPLLAAALAAQQAAPASRREACPFVEALAASRPCAAVAAVLAAVPASLQLLLSLPPASHPAQLPTGKDSLTLGSYNIWSMDIATSLMCLAMESQHPTLCADLHSARLLPHACAAATAQLALAQQPGVPLCPATLPALVVTYRMFTIHLTQLITAALARGADSSDGGQQLPQVALDEPAVPRLLLQTLALWRAPCPPATDAGMTLMALHDWMSRSVAAGAWEGVAAALQVTPGDVASVLQAEEASLDVRLQLDACVTSKRLLQQLPGLAEQHRAFSATAVFLERALDSVLLGLVASADAASNAREGSLVQPPSAPLPDGMPPMMSTVQLRLPYLVDLLHTSLSLSDASASGTRVPAEEMKRQRSRAVWLLQRRLLGKLEAVLRATAPWGDHQGFITGMTSDLAARVWVPLLSDPQHAAAASLAYQSILATLRKAADTALPRTVLASGRLLPSAFSLTSSWNMSSRLLYSWQVRGQWLPDATQADEAVGPLPALLTVTAHLLHPAVRLSRHPAEVCGVIAVDKMAEMYCDTLSQLMWLLHAGCADAAAALGAPVLLHRLLHPLGPFAGSEDWQPEVADQALRVLTLCRHSTPWMHEVRRLRLLDSVRECYQRCGCSVPAACAAVSVTDPCHWPSLEEPEGHAHPSVGRFVAGVLAMLRQRMTALTAAAPVAMAPAWDSLLLSSLAGVPPSADRPFPGCCHRNCTNLAGCSEAVLPLRKCAGCQIARYCSEECQRRAWRQGHRAACQAWQRKQVPLAPAVVAQA